MVPRPATAPEIIPRTYGLPRFHHSSAIHTQAPAHAARWVETMAITARELALKAGDMIVLLDSRGTRTVSGPGTFPAVAAGMRAGTAETAARILANTGTSERRGGAVRGGTTSVETRSPNLWLVDLTKSGTVCVANADAVRVWRGATDRAAEVKVSSAAGSGTISLPAGASIGEWPKSAPIADGAEYMIAADGAAPVSVKFVTVTPPEPVEDTASLLIAKGCKAQLDLLIATTRGDDTAG